MHAFRKILAGIGLLGALAAGVVWGSIAPTHQHAGVAELIQRPGHVVLAEVYIQKPGH
jgi:hypothetical protein